MSTNILTVGSIWLLSLTQHTAWMQQHSNVDDDEKWWGKTWQFLLFFHIDSQFFFCARHQIKRLQFILLASPQKNSLQKVAFMSFTIHRNFCIFLSKKTLIHNDDTWLKFLIDIESTVKNSISQYFSCTHSLIVSMMYTRTHFFVDYDALWACDFW